MSRRTKRSSGGSQSWTSLGKFFSAVSAGVSGLFGFGYNATDPRRKILDQSSILYASRSSANELLTGSITALRSHCRHLVRNNPTAKAGVEAFSALLVGTGIALEPDTGDEKTNVLIRDQWNKWIKSADVDGRDLYCLQTEAARELPTAGEAIWRFVVDPSLAKDGGIPVRILTLEGEWLIDGVPEGGATAWVAGIQLDDLARPVAYYLANPATERGEIVPASHIAHIFERTRSMQARGEPGLSPVIETLMNERDLVDAELYAAKQTAAMALVITAERHDALDTTESGDGSDPAQNVRLGGVARLYPGEDIKAFSHTRPSQQIAPFRQMLRGDIAAALRIPQRYLDRDVGRANYSSMRADMLDTQRLLSPLREQFGHMTAGRAYRFVLPYLAMAAGIKCPRSDYRLIPDGQPYIDPQKDIAAAREAIDAGLSTFEKEIGARGEDYRQVFGQNRAEQLNAAMANVEMIKGIQDACTASGVPGLTWSHILTLGGAASAPGAYLAASVSAPEATVVAGDVPADQAASAPTPDEAEAEDEGDKAEGDRSALVHARRLDLARASAPVMNVTFPAAAPIEIRNELPAQPAPVVHVDVQPSPSAAIEVRNEITQAAQPAPVVTVNVPQQAAPVVNVKVPKQETTINNQVVVPARTVRAVPQKDGSVVMTPEE